MKDKNNSIFKKLKENSKAELILSIAMFVIAAVLLGWLGRQVYNIRNIDAIIQGYVEEDINEDTDKIVSIEEDLPVVASPENNTVTFGGE